MNVLGCEGMTMTGRQRGAGLLMRHRWHPCPASAVPGQAAEAKAKADAESMSEPRAEGRLMAGRLVHG
jgi:hypothetical protein